MKIDLDILCREVLKDHPLAVSRYFDGEKGLIGLFMGEIMKRSKGKVDPKEANKMLIKYLTIKGN